jgi:hypothetical protein
MVSVKAATRYAFFSNYAPPEPSILLSLYQDMHGSLSCFRTMQNLHHMLPPNFVALHHMIYVQHQLHKVA